MLAKPCKVLPGFKDKDGYRQVSVNGKTKRAHRVAWECHYGPIPPKMLVRHRCDNPPCEEITHLVLGTTQQNVQDRVSRNRSACGTKQGQARLDWDRVHELRQLRSEGWSGPQLARYFGVCLGTVQKVYTNKTWRE